MLFGIIGEVMDAKIRRIPLKIEFPVKMVK
jgi:hypothetical protein